VTSSVLACASENGAEAEEGTSECPVRCLAFVDRAGRLLGILSLADLSRGAGQDQPTDSGIGGTPASVAEERPSRAGQAPRGR
jgi:CBS domain-containing protein